MSDYDYRPNYQRGPGAMDYSNSGSGGGLWPAIGLVAVLAFIGLIIYGAVTAPETGAEVTPAVPAPTDGTGQ
ncbi:MAG: hypothetical protein AAFQ79_08310 [Pseudomonadota bacterium]